MKRFTGLLLTIAGGVATILGGYYAITGQAATQIPITSDFSISAMVLGLTGVAVVTVGLVWMRD